MVERSVSAREALASRRRFWVGGPSGSEPQWTLRMSGDESDVDDRVLEEFEVPCKSVLHSVLQNRGSWHLPMARWGMKAAINRPNIQLDATADDAR